MANKVYIARESTTVFQESSGNVVITLLNMLTTVARVSARFDRGTGSNAGWHEWRMTFQSDTTPVFGQTVDLYASYSDGTLEDGDVGTGDAAVLVNVLKNLDYLGSVAVQVQTATVDHRSSGRFFIPTRYYSLIVHNNTEDSLENTANVNTITVTPIPDEIQ